MRSVQIKTRGSCTAVKCIAQNWQTSACKVHTNLMGTAGVEAAFYKKTLAAFYSKLLENTKIGF